jgi:hypothetical protein
MILLPPTITTGHHQIMMLIVRTGTVALDLIPCRKTMMIYLTRGVKMRRDHRTNSMAIIRKIALRNSVLIVHCVA